jgi:hypothetical protein
VASYEVKRVSAMTQKAVTSKFVIPEVLAVAFGITILIGIVYLTGKYPVPVVRADADHSVAGSPDIAELPNLRLSRVHLLLSRWY